MEIGSYYNDEKQRWIIVHNKEIEQRSIKSAIKKFERNIQKDLKAIKKYEKEKFDCENDALRALEKFKKALLVTDIEGFETIEHKRYSKRGKPKKDDVKDVIEYSLSLTTTPNQSKLDEEKKRAGIFVLATNELNNKMLKSEEE